MQRFFINIDPNIAVFEHEVRAEALLQSFWWDTAKAISYVYVKRTIRFVYTVNGSLPPSKSAVDLIL